MTPACHNRPELTAYLHPSGELIPHDEITVARECIATTRDLRLRKQMQAKLKELLAEEGRRQTHEDLPL